ncbi:MAG: nicotinate phosphoribosyltransferase, partial [Endomicrobia bacterium]|nr:nicotinate phosphoribosyltransferase [Endomicrobiia bacterium]
MSRGSPIDVFGVGTKLVCGHPDAALSGVYKIVAKKENRKYLPLMKISDTPEKISLPHIKNITRFFTNEKILFDIIHI